MKHGRIEDRVFYDCVLTIIDKTDTSEADILVKVRTMYLDGEYDEPMSLKGIREMFPEARIITVFAENALKGRVYRYGNHGDFWEYVGDTIGYA